MRDVRAAALVVVAVAIAGCGPSSTFDDFVRGVGKQAPSKLQSLDLEKKADQAVVSAFCNVAADVVNFNRPLSEPEWVQAMEADARANFPDLAVDQVRTRIDRLKASVSLASINPQLASRYVQNCPPLSRPRS